MCAYYVVFKGKKRGVYNTWAECSVQVLGYPGAVHKKFSTYDEAIEAFKEFGLPGIGAVDAIAVPALTLSLKSVILFLICDFLAVLWVRMTTTIGH